MTKYTFMDDFLGGGDDATAIRCDSDEITYRQLRETIATLSCRIRRVPLAARERIVVVFCEKSVECVSAIYSILRAGAAYAPFDTALPDEKIVCQIETARPVAFVTQAAHAPRLRAIVELTSFADTPIFVLDGRGCLTGEVPGAEPCTVLCRSARDLAYVIFTSGSSGKPKGVMIRHESGVAFVEHIMSLRLYDHTTVYLNLSPFYFDASILDVFCVLGAGGTLILAKKVLMASVILKCMVDYQITDTLMISSVMRLFTVHCERRGGVCLPSLRSIYYGGEACHVDVVRRTKALFPQVRFLHAYGPTETTVSAMVHLFDEIRPEDGPYMTIGKILPTMYGYALNGRGERIVPGELGELYLGGVQVMAGYIGDPERTKQVLVEDRFNQGQVVYQTGDLVTINENGDYFFKGRADDLVKVGGNLVSICEVENAIRQHPSIEDAIVAKRSDEILGNTLVAWVVPNTPSLTKSPVLAFLREKLAHFMIPSELVFIAESDVGLTSNGKLNRSKLVEGFEALG